MSCPKRREWGQCRAIEHKTRPVPGANFDTKFFDTKFCSHNSKYMSKYINMTSTQDTGYWQKDMKNVNSSWVCLHSPRWWKTLIGALVLILLFWSFCFVLFSLLLTSHWLFGFHTPYKPLYSLRMVFSANAILFRISHLLFNQEQKNWRLFLDHKGAYMNACPYPSLSFNSDN